MLALYIALGVLGGLLLIWFIYGFNKMIRYRNAADKALSNMDVFFKKRYDLIPNMVNTVKGYMEHEKNLITEVTEARAEAMNTKKGRKRAFAESKLGDALGNMVAVAENYPDLKASANFIELQNTLSKMENEIAQAREAYNDAATELNTHRELFPDSIVSFLMGVKKYPLFKAKRRERKNVKVKF